MANMFDENGNYNKTEWKPGDRITAGKLNKIEESLEAINNNDIERYKEADERLDALEEQNEAVEERFDELEDLVADNKSEVDTAIYEVHSKMDRLETKLDDGIDTVEAIAHTVDDKIAAADASMKTQVAEAEDIVDQGKADMEAMVAEVESDLEGLHAKDEEINSRLYHMEYKHINVLKLGMDNSGNTSAINTEILNGLATSISGCKVTFPSGIYLIEDHWDIREQNNFEIEFSKDAVLKVKEGTKISHIFNLTSCKNFKIINPTIDGNNIKGLNGLAFNGLSYTNYCGDGYIENLVVRNLFRKAVTDEYEWSGGGRALTFQFAVMNINVNGVNVKNCTTAVDFHGRFENESTPHAPVLGIQVNNVFAEDCEEVISGYALLNGNQEPDNPNAVNVRINDVFARNCGKSTNELSNTGANNDGTDGGVFVFSRARFIEINNATILNDFDYGKIGGLYRGTGQHIKINNVFCDIECYSLINSSPARNLMPVVPNEDIITTNLDIRNVYMNGVCDYVLIHNANSLNKLYRSKFINIEVGEVQTSLVNDIAASKVGNYLDVKSTISLERIKGDIYDIKIRKNNFSESTNIEELIAHKQVFTQQVKVSGQNSIVPIVIERTGSNAAIGTIYAYGNNVCIGTESLSHIVKCNTTTRNFEIGSGTWDGGHLVMRNRHIWVDSTGKIRMKNGAPTSDTDGIEVSLGS